MDEIITRSESRLLLALLCPRPTTTRPHKPYYTASHQLALFPIRLLFFVPVAITFDGDLNNSGICYTQGRDFRADASVISMGAPREEEEKKNGLENPFKFSMDHYEDDSSTY